uniref:Uncharacterized protein n=1 Tax=Anguilla anguilla TaxID=7936 RepID=A0A0E9URG1_ANGAN
MRPACLDELAGLVHPPSPAVKRNRPHHCSQALASWLLPATLTNTSTTSFKT